MSKLPFKIDQYLENSTQDKELKQKIICVHDDLYTAYKILESIKDALGLKEAPSENVLMAVFSELRKI